MAQAGSNQMKVRRKRDAATWMPLLWLGLGCSGDPLVDGDAAQSPDSSEDAPSPVGQTGVISEGLKVTGVAFRWPGGVVPYAFDSSVSASDQALTVTAMAEWEAKVPGIDFVPRTTQVDYIRFVFTGACKSPYGRQTGAQDIDISTSCLQDYKVHHEIGHALGLLHQHTRKDRDNYVEVQWHNIVGCPSTATSKQDCGETACTANPEDCGCTAVTIQDCACCWHGQFANDSSPRSDIGDYDYDSVMHYFASQGAKPGTLSLRVLLTDGSGNPFPIGQRTHLSWADIAAVRAMYPVLGVQRSIFSGTGQQRICSLHGRTADIAVEFDMTGSSPGITSPTVNRAMLATGDYTVDCTAESTFWDDDYDYPNTTVAFNSALTAETYRKQATTRVLPVSLAAALFP
jgi:hypothetical protein